MISGPTVPGTDILRSVPDAPGHRLRGITTQTPGASEDTQVGGRRPTGRLCAAGDRPCYYLAVHEVRRAAIQEAAAVNLGPGDEPIENFAPQEGPHRRPVPQKVLDALGPELVAVTLAWGAGE